MDEELNEVTEVGAAEETAAEDVSTEVTEAEPTDMLGAMFADDAADDAAEDEPEPSAEGEGGALVAGETAEPETPATEEASQLEPEQQAAADEIEVPEDLSPKAQDRFRQLANENKELKAREQDVEQLHAGVQQIQQTIQSAFNDVSEFEEVITYATAVKEGRFEDARELLLKQVLQFEAHTGQSLTGGLVSQYQDLSDRVNNYELTEQDAMELAQNRFKQGQQQQAMQRQQQQAQEQYQAQQAQQMEQQQYQASYDAAVNEVGQMCGQWRATDLNWQANSEALLKYSAEHLQNKVHPSQWPAMVSAHYLALRSSTVRQPVTSPLSPAVPTDAVKKEPSNMMDAMFS